LRCLTLPHPPPPTCPAAAKKLVLTFGTTALAVVLAAVVSYVAASPTFGWTGRSLSLLDPTYASKYIPIIASVSGARRQPTAGARGGARSLPAAAASLPCRTPRLVLSARPGLRRSARPRPATPLASGRWVVRLTAPPPPPKPHPPHSCVAAPPPPPPVRAEHQPPSWSSYFTDLHLASLLAPAGMLLCFRPLTDASLFLLLYGVTAVYFSGVMVRARCSGPPPSWRQPHSRPGRPLLPGLAAAQRQPGTRLIMSCPSPLVYPHTRTILPPHHHQVRLMLVLAPAACCLAGLALSEVTAYLAASLAAAPRGEDKQEGRAEAAGGRRAHAGMPAPHCILRIEQPAPPRLLLHASQRVPTPLPTRTPPTQRSPPAPRRAPPGRPPRRAASTPGRAALAAAAAGWLAPGTRCPATSPSWAWCWCLGA
jgi:hypothetical protein